MSPLGKGKSPTVGWLVGCLAGCNEIGRVSKGGEGKGNGREGGNGQGWVGGLEGGWGGG